VFDWVASDGDDSHYSATFALFATPGCPICDRLAGDLATVAISNAYRSVRFLWIDGGREPSHVLPSPWISAFSRHNNAHIAMEIPGTPFAYLVSAEGRIAGKGLINSAADIETLISNTNGVVRSGTISRVSTFGNDQI
jgi:hypothetical protein